MRVTKLVREYIEREVSKKFNEKDLELKSIQEKHEKARLQFEKELKKIRLKADVDVEKAIKNCGYIGSREEYVEISTYGISNPYYSELNKRKNELVKIKRDKIDEILITLELGGTRNDLDEMLSKIEL